MYYQQMDRTVNRHIYHMRRQNEICSQQHFSQDMASTLYSDIFDMETVPTVEGRQAYRINKVVKNAGSAAALNLDTPWAAQREG